MPPPHPPLTTRPDVVLHAGTGKTGTSTVQRFLRDNRARLAELGVLFPQSAGAARHVKLNLFMRTEEELADSPQWHRRKQKDPDRFRRRFRRELFAEIEEAGLPRVLFTDEEIFKASDAALRRLRRITGPLAANLREVVYLRRQDDHLVSRYQEGVKIGWVKRLDEWALEDFSGLYDYAANLARHRRLLGADELVVHRFDRSFFPEGSLLQDFLDAAGIDARASDLDQVEDRNKSLDAESVEFLRLLNVHRVREQGETPGLIDHRSVFERLAEASSGPTLTLGDSFLDSFMERWEESNRRVAREFLGDPTGVLFPTPRRTRDTTTDQVLDPSRVEHFFTLLDIPEELHQPVRRLAEKEAWRR
jgi:hypothetical protein